MRNKKEKSKEAESRYVSKEAGKSRKQRSREGGKAKTWNNSRKAEKQRGSTVEKQRSEEAEKWRSREQRTIKAEKQGKAEK